MTCARRASKAEPAASRPTRSASRAATTRATSPARRGGPPPPPPPPPPGRGRGRSGPGPRAPDPPPGRAGRPLAQGAARLEVGGGPSELEPQRIDALAGGRDGRHDRRPPPVGAGSRRRAFGAGRQLEHLLEVATGLGLAGPIRLV